MEMIKKKIIQSIKKDNNVTGFEIGEIGGFNALEAWIVNERGIL